jgi:hypothetical protein
MIGARRDGAFTSSDLDVRTSSHPLYLSVVRECAEGHFDMLQNKPSWSKRNLRPLTLHKLA